MSIDFLRCCIIRHLIIARVGRVTIPIPILRTSSRGGSSSGILVASPATKPAFLGLWLGTKLDVSWGRVARQVVIAILLGVVLGTVPEPFAATRGVGVSGGGAEALLALVVAGQEDLEEDGDEEEEAGRSRKLVLDRSR